MIVTKEAAEVENEQLPPAPSSERPVQAQKLARTATRPHRPIDVVTVDPQPETSPDGPEAAFSSVSRVRLYSLHPKDILFRTR